MNKVHAAKYWKAIVTKATRARFVTHDWFGFCSDWLRNWRTVRFYSQSQRKATQNYSSQETQLTINLRTSFNDLVTEIENKKLMPLAFRD